MKTTTTKQPALLLCAPMYFCIYFIASLAVFFHKEPHSLHDCRDGKFSPWFSWSNILVRSQTITWFRLHEANFQKFPEDVNSVQHELQRSEADVRLPKSGNAEMKSWNCSFSWRSRLPLPPNRCSHSGSPCLKSCKMLSACCFRDASSLTSGTFATIVQNCCVNTWKPPSYIICLALSQVQLHPRYVYTLVRWHERKIFQVPIGHTVSHCNYLSTLGCVGKCTVRPFDGARLLPA